MSLKSARCLLAFALFAAPACDSNDTHSPTTSSASLITVPTATPTAPTAPAPNHPGPAMPLPFPAPNPLGPIPLPAPAPNSPVGPPVFMPGFLIVVTPKPQSILPGGQIQFVVSVQSVNGFRGVVTLLARILPDNERWAGFSWSPQPVMLAPGELTTSTLTIVTNKAAPVGQQTITVEGRSADIRDTANLLLTVR